MKILEHILLACCVLTLMPPPAGAQEAQQLMDRMAGVYKHRFMSDTVEDGSYQAEDVIEIVPYDDSHVYVSVGLDFYNGHVCGISGIARYEQGAFVYHGREREPDGYPQCALRVSIDKDKLRLTDRDNAEGRATCAGFCGVRGSLTYEIGMDQRRPISYMDQLKSSRLYKAAIEELEKFGR